MCIVDEIVFDHGVMGFEIAVERGVGDAGIDDDGGTGCSRHTLEVVISDAVVAADDADASGACFVLAEEAVAFDQIIVAVTKCEGAAGAIEDVAADNVPAGFDRDGFSLSIAGFEEVVLDDAVSVFFRVVAMAELYRFEAVSVAGSTIKEVVVIDPVLSVILNYDGLDDDAPVFHPRE